MTQDHQDLRHPFDVAPLLIFSVYTHIQCETIRSLGRKIIAALDKGIQEDGTGTDFNGVYGDFWLWVIGSYEIVRTMTDEKTGAPNCFSPQALDSLKQLKKALANLRMPMAKQELQGSHTEIISNEASYATINFVTKDAAFKIKGQLYWIREMVTKFESTFSNISKGDVLKDLREGKN